MNEVLSWLLDLGFIVAGLACGWRAMRHWRTHARLPGPWRVLARVAPGESAWVAGWFEPLGADPRKAVVERVELVAVGVPLANVHDAAKMTFVDSTGRMEADLRGAVVFAPAEESSVAFCELSVAERAALRASNYRDMPSSVIRRRRVVNAGQLVEIHGTRRGDTRLDVSTIVWRPGSPLFSQLRARSAAPALALVALALIAQGAAGAVAGIWSRFA